ncbi:hypothetical protein [Synechococcus sp. CS-1332]|uniref:hypothetical protein n=1 Tax=Synechococcus sp. CS-1332 TaxID=2847972 RepID=UPI00223A6A1B|nr:hypothetical protein [Synechococcus sp. CS-1332]MCT0207798.1 hypothetical protein [Synechococcus sp. CS-1332]
MARPRWHQTLPLPSSGLGRRWDRFVALWAALNLVWVAFDVTYIPLRTFWLQRNLYPLPSVPLVLPLTFIPDITPWVDPIKGIEPHRETQAYRAQFDRLDAALRQGPPGQLSPAQDKLLADQVRLTAEMIDSNPMLASGTSGTLEKIKNRLRQRADKDSAKQAAAVLLSPAWLSSHPWEQERLFWRQQVLPLVATTYWRSIDENGRPTDHFWRYDLILFQSVFALDILLRAYRLRRRLPGLSWNRALLRRWIDLPLLLPFWRLLRVVPVLERLHTSGLITIEPIRAVISRGVVALLAVELFEVLALQLIDGLQQLIRSRRWPMRIRALRSHQTVVSNDERELVELVRIWGPLLLVRVAPRLAPELQGVLGHALQQSLQNAIVPPGLRQLQPLLQMEKGLSRQLAGGMVDSLLDLTRSTGERLSRRDDQQLELLQRFIDRFWEELADALESGPALERSQQLLCTFLEEFKGTYLSQISRAGIEGLIEELDQLMVKGAQGPGEGNDPT